MRSNITVSRAAGLAASVLIVLALQATGPDASYAADRIKCELSYTIKGWSVVYRTGKGSGTISCSDGTRASVSIMTHGGGLTLGTFQVIDGKGGFSRVYAVDDLFGTYVEAVGHAGAGSSVEGRGMFKGNSSLAISGNGTGINLGFAFGGFTIRRQ